MKQTRSLGRMISLLAPLRLYRLGQNSRVDAELAAYAAAFEAVEELLDRTRTRAFVQSADEEALRRYESLVGLPERQDISPERRRDLILYRLGVAPFDFTAEKMLNTVRAAGIEARILEDSAGESLNLQTLDLIDPTLNMDIARMRLNTLLPAHLEWELDFGRLTWDLLEEVGPDWDRWDSLDFSWEQFDTGGQEVFGAHLS